jgi:N-acetylmuramoyl-L-alanine amidase
MKQKEIAIVGTALAASIMFFAGVIYGRATTKSKKIVKVIAKKEPIKEESVEETIDISDEDINQIAILTMAEAEGECELAKRLVIDTILNRFKSEHFPDTIEDIIYEHNQFEAVKNGRIEQCYVKEDLCRLVREELKRQISYDVVFFRTKHYSDYGYPLIQCGTHYFSIYE